MISKCGTCAEMNAHPHLIMGKTKLILKFNIKVCHIAKSTHCLMSHQFRKKQGSNGITQRTIKRCTISMMINKITHSVDNYK